ncbi:VPLPA-CTERM sorting domain-containing protein [Cereibacter sp. SYSU M97828]|nr:VPLPA-CTERM sorting domain-containing protein [Cereibacter flavus]
MKTISMISGGAVLALSLSAPSVFSATINTLSGKPPAVIAHRGASSYLPENSMGAYELGAVMGSDYVETDVMMSKDGIGIVMHDASLARTTNVEDLFAPRNGGYLVADFTAAEMKTLTTEPTRTAGTSYPGFTPTLPNADKVVTFDEFLDGMTAYNEANGTDVGIVVEAKEGAFRPDMNRYIIDALAAKGYDAASNVVLQAFNFSNTAQLNSLADEAGIVAEAHQLGDPSEQNGIFGVASQGTFQTLEFLSSYLDTVAVYNAATLSSAFVDAAHALGLGVNVWTLRPGSQEEAFAQVQPLIDLGVDGIITDNPDWVRTVVDANTPAPVPLPAALPLLLAGIGALGLAARKRRT